MTTDITKQKITSRDFTGEDDYWNARTLLEETYPLVPPDFNWEVRRWDGSYHHNEKSGFDARWKRDGKILVRLWETENGKIVGAAHPEGNRGDAYMQIHPDYRHIEEEMIIWAEENLSVSVGDGKKHQLYFGVYEYDSPRQRIMVDRGYEKLNNFEVIRRLRFGGKAYIPHPDIAEGYKIRSVNPADPDDWQRTADLLNPAFGRTIHNAGELENFWANSPSFNREIELMAEASDGSFAAYVGMTYDEKYKFGHFEPVCTHPDHRQKGLASCLMYEGMHRIKAMGATDVYVGTGPMLTANLLYESLGFTEIYTKYIWLKRF